MNNVLQLLSVTYISLLTWLSCNKEVKTSYIDLETGKEVLLVKNEATGAMVNAETWKPVRIYVNTKTKDTIYGPTGKIINNKLIRLENNRYIYSEDDDYYKIKNGDTLPEKLNSAAPAEKSPDTSIDETFEKRMERDKKKKERIDDVVIKIGDRKVEINEETGERKIKEKKD